MPRAATAKIPTLPAPGNTPDPFVEIGDSGLRRWGGQMAEEFLPDLQGPRGRRMYREMSWNDSIIAAILYAIEMLLRQGPLKVQPGGTSPEDLRAHDLVETALDDMSLTWADTLSDLLTCLVYGWAWCEVIYKHRDGPDQVDGAHRSRYADGLIGWRKWALRSQLSLAEWVFDESGGVQAMVQQPPTKPRVEIPIERSLLFKTKNAGGSPEGTSILRAAYKAYYFSKRIETLEGIGIERDLAGLPEIKIPGYLMAATASAGDKAIFESYKQLGERVRNDGQSCIVLPSDRDPSGNPLYEFNLKSTGGRRQFDTDAVIGRYNFLKAVVVLGDFILLGHEQRGTQALSVDKTDIFGEALSAFQDSIYAVINRHEIPRLLALNGIRVDSPPQLVGGRVVAPPLGEIGALLQGLAGAGMPVFPDDPLENAIRARAGLPPKEGSDPVSLKRQRRRRIPETEKGD